MSQLNINTIKNKRGDYGPNLVGHSTVTGDLNVTGTITGDVTGGVTGNVTGNATGLSGSPNIVVGSITASGNVSIAGTLTYEDVTNVDSIGIITARSDISIADKIVHTGDTNTAIRFPAADTFTVETAGTEQVRIDSSGRLGLGTTSPSDRLHVMESSASAVAASGSSVAQFERAGNAAITISTADTGQSTVFFGDTVSSTTGRIQYDHSSNSLGFWANALERARIDSSGRLLVGTSSAYSVNGTNGWQFQIAGTGAVGPAYSRFSNNPNPARINFFKSRATSQGGFTTVQTNDDLGGISFLGADGTAAVVGAEIKATVDGTPGANDMPGRLTFSTTADGAASPTERLRINSSGQIGLGGANYGTTGQVITSNGSGSAPTWQDAGGGAWNLISTVNASGASTVNLTGIDNTYSSYCIKVTNATLTPGSSGRSMYCQFITGGGTSVPADAGFLAWAEQHLANYPVGDNIGSTTINYERTWQMQGLANPGDNFTQSIVGGPYLVLTNEINNATNKTDLELHLMRPGESYGSHQFWWHAISQETDSTNWRFRHLQGEGSHAIDADVPYATSGSAISGVQITINRNNFDSGTVTGKFQLYGMS